MNGLRPSRGFQDEIRAGGMPVEPPAIPVRAASPPNPNQTFFQLDILRSLQLHRGLAVGIFAAAVLIAAAYMGRSWDRYAAESLVYVQPAPQRLMDNGPTQRWPSDSNSYESYIQQQIHTVTRPDVLVAAVHKLPGWQDGSDTEQAAAARLDRAVEVVRVGAGYQLSITAKAGSAVQAAKIANAVAEAFIESSTRELRSGDTQRIELLGEERDRIQKELSSDRAEQENLNKKLGIAAVAGATPDPYDEQIAAVRTELVKARTANDEAAARLTSLAKAGSSTAAMDAEADEVVSSDAGMVSMKTALNKRRSDLISQMANLTPSHPQYKQNTEELAKINTSIDAISKELRDKAAAHIQQRLKNDLERTSGVEAQLNSQLAQLTGAAGSATPRLQRSNELATDIVRLQNRFAVVDEQFRNLTMESNAPGAVYVASAATPPLNADHAKMFRNGLILIVLGLVLGLGASLVAHNMDPRIYVAKDVERILGFPPMAMLPDFHEVSPGVSEEYMLRLAAAVEHAHHEGGLKSCIFTGVAPGAGATTVATRITGMLQAMGRETVLVDASGMQPAETDGGPTDSTDLVAAPRGSRSTALLQHMADVTAGESIVVTDTAPLLVSGETEYLARFVDSAIVVIESGVTTKTQLRELAKTLQRLEVSSVGFVLNRVSMGKATSSFRDSVKAVEQHLHAQARAFARNTARNQQPAQSQREAHAEPRVARNRHKTDQVPETVEEPAVASARDLNADVPIAQERNTSKEPVAKTAAAGRANPEAAEPAVSPGRFVAPEPAREPVISSAQAVTPDAAFKPYRFITPEPSFEQPQSPVGGARASASAPAWPAAPTKPVAPPAVPREPAAKQPEPPPARPAGPPVTAQVSRGREPMRTVPHVAASSIVEGAQTPRYIPPASVAEGPKPSVPTPSTVEARMVRTPVASVGEPSEPAYSYAASAAQTVKPATQASSVPPKFGSGAPAASVPMSGMFGTTTASPGQSRPVTLSADSRSEPGATSAVPEPPESLGYRAESPGYRAESPSYRVSEPASSAPMSTSRPSEQAPAAEEADDLPYSAASRLGGLRNLLVSLGLKALSTESEYGGRSQDEERNAERSVYAEPISVSPARGAVETLPPDAASVRAKPEFLPPRPVTETTEREKEPVRPVPKRLRWDAPEDVETLPSWRGQYRKRR
jgi:succinoglycan biosynthesis transport protein ExoP